MAYLNRRNIFLISLAIIAFDQLSKYLARSKLELGQAFELIPGFIEVHLSHNTGIAFSLFDSQPMILTILVSLINIAIIFYIFKLKEVSLGFAFIIGGALSNLLDRYIFGYVTDFINPIFIDFAIFNLADVSLNIGAFLLALSLILNPKLQNQ